MIKQLLKYQLIDINKFIIRFYQRLSLSELEAFMLIQLFQMYDCNKVVLSYVQLRKNLALDKKEMNSIIQSLISKGLIDMEVEISKSGKEQEILKLDKAIAKMEDIINQDILEEEKKQIELQLKDIIDLFERELGRTLAPTELNLITTNFKNVNISDVENAIINISKNEKLTINAVIDYLEMKDKMEQKVDKKDEEAILGFFKSINKKSK